uniref:phosphatidylinositol-3,4-bisphosphate 4-phosphatase n=1 Tax=Xenopsylla cheopis TaxID=163159 RepID=A0A6M2DE89_XENCH
MRFNKIELEALAVQPSHRFDREGVLFIRERQDGFFRRNEGPDYISEKDKRKSNRLSCVGAGSKVLQGRWCRLRGNLLFYLRDAEPWSEAAGLLVLENCTASEEPLDASGLWPFSLTYEGGMSQRMAAATENDRTSWLKALQSASYKCMRTKLHNLQAQIQNHSKGNSASRTLELKIWRNKKVTSVDLYETPLCEVCMNCDNLLCDGHGRPPSVFIELRVLTSGLWIKYGRTEIIQRSSNPCFLSTINLYSSDGLDVSTKLQFTVFDIYERMSNTATFLGSSTVVLGNIMEATKVRIPLKCSSGSTCGFITISVTIPEVEHRTPGSPAISAPVQTAIHHRRSHSLPPRLIRKQFFPSQAQLQTLFSNACLHTYRMHSGLGGEICAVEIMLESKLCFALPQQLLNLWIEHEKELLQEVSAMGELGGAWRNPQIQLLDRHLHLLQKYSQAKQHLQLQLQKSTDNTTLHYKPSSTKYEPSLEFAPTNLHLQRMWAHNDTLGRAAINDIVTVGAFASHCNSTKTGGLVCLVQQLKQLPEKDLDNACKVDAANNAIQAIKQLRRQLVDCMIQLLALAKTKQSSGMMPLCEDMINRSKSLLTIWDAGFVEEALRFIDAQKVVPDKMSENDSGFIEAKLPSELSPFRRITQQFDNLEIASPDLEDFSSPHLPSKKWPSSTEMVQQSNLTFNETHFDINGSIDKVSTNKQCQMISKSSVDSVLSSPASNYYKPTEEPEPWDLTQLNIEASIMCLVSKVKFLCGRCGSPAIRLKTQRQSTRMRLANSKNDKDSNGLTETTTPKPAIRGNKFTDGLDLSTTNDWVGELRPSMRKLRQAMDGYLKTARLTHSVFRLQQNTRAARKSASLQLRRDICFSQALTALVTGICARVWGGPIDNDFMLVLSTIGAFASFEGLLTLHGSELDMWGDMIVAIEDLTTVTFRLEGVQSMKLGGVMPHITGSRNGLTVTIPVPNHTISKQPVTFKVTPVFFNVGINEKVPLAEALGQNVQQRKSNLDNYSRLVSYYQQYQKVSICPGAQNLVDKLKICLHNSSSKNVEILHLAGDICRSMRGFRFTSCKSAKDRTGMSVTLEQCRILSQDFHLSSQEFPKALNAMRSQGCRIDNTYKNINVRKYAFNSLQVLALPLAYRPPVGTYGSLQT